MKAPAAPPVVPTGHIKMFGPFGPMYEVGRAVGVAEGGDQLVEVRLVDNGEVVTYRLSHILHDPEAH
jgi:hypothetical protein